MFYNYLLTNCHGFVYFAGIWAFIETFFLAGYRAGWASLVYVLKKENIYQSVCQNSTEVSFNSTTKAISDTADRSGDLVGGVVKGCPEQDALFELCVAISMVLGAPINLLISQVNFSFGMRASRILSVFMLLVGAFAFGVISRGILLTEVTMGLVVVINTSWLIFIGYTCISNGGLGILQANIQVSYLFVRCSSTIIGAMCGAFDASSAVFLGVKLAYEHGVSMSTSFIVIGCMVLLALISTFFFLPKNFIRPVTGKIYDPAETENSVPDNDATTHNLSEKTCLINGKGNISIKDKTFRSVKGEEVSKESGCSNTHAGATGGGGEDANRREDKQEDRRDGTQSSSLSAATQSDKTSYSVLWQYIFSPLYVLQMIWLSINQLLFVFFIGSLNAWLGHLTHWNEAKVSHYTNFFFSVMLSAPIFSILSGASVDFLKWIQSDSKNHKTRLMYALAGPSAFTTMIGVLLCACVISEREEVTYVISFISVMYRSALYSYWATFLRELLPTDYFAGLYGFMLVVCGVLTLLQYPLFLWCQSSDSGYRQVYGMLGLLTLTTLAQPTYLIWIGRKSPSESESQSERDSK